MELPRTFYRIAGRPKGKKVIGLEKSRGLHREEKENPVPDGWFTVAHFQEEKLYRIAIAMEQNFNAR